MRYITFDPPGITLSRLAFGCAPVMGKIGRRAALRAMALAFEQGVTHFDVARSYGFGEAERVLGEFAADRRDRITIATKFGIAPARNAGLLRFVKPLVRSVVRHVPGAGSLVRSASRQALAHGRYDLASAQASFGESLRQLRTDHVDILFVHEPAPSDELGPELLDYVERLRKAGRIRAWGLATRRAWTPTLFDRLDVKPDFIQCEYNVLHCRPFSGALARLPAILHSPFGGAGAVDELRVAVAERGVPSEITALPRDAWARLMLEFAVHGGGDKPVLCSMFDAAHVRHNVEAVDHPHFTEEVAVLGACCARPAAGPFLASA